MYTQYYGLTSAPFQLTPDERFFFASRPHRKAFAYLNYGLSKAEGFVVVTGEIGAGKTTVLAHLRATLKDPRLHMAWLTTTQVTSDDLLRLIAAAFGLPADATPGDKATLLRQLESFLQHAHEQGKRACLVIDEAQSLLAESLEELRMLSNFSREGHALLQIFLVGQPEFRKLIQREDLEQLRQRVVVSFHLPPLDAEETRMYIEHRLEVAGWKGRALFSDAVYDAVFAHSSGIPRKINLLCDRLLLHGFLLERTSIERADADAVIAELQQELPPAASSATVSPATAPDAQSLVDDQPPASVTEDARTDLKSISRSPAETGQQSDWKTWTSTDDQTEAEQERQRSRRRGRRRWLLWALLILGAMAFIIVAYGVLRPS